ncbi:MAG: hypothetical protein Kow0029_03480 [Candidatus Rifleibacteriota bacterium]
MAQRAGVEEGKIIPGDKASIAAYCKPLLPDIFNRTRGELKSLSASDADRVREFFMGFCLACDDEVLFKEILEEISPERRDSALIKAAKGLLAEGMKIPLWLMGLVREVALNTSDKALAADAMILVLEHGKDLPEPQIETTKYANSYEKCQSNQRVICGALDMCILDGRELPVELNLDELVAWKYLQERPVCPDGGEYFYYLTDDNDLVVECSVHSKQEGN